jgi:molybdopterin molybdotransferase
MPDQLISIARARDIIQADVQPLPAEAVAIVDAFGRALGEDVHAAGDVPPFMGSAMDGFAVHSGPGGRVLRIIGESRAGAPFSGSLAPDCAIRISTGAVVPAGIDAVVPVERTSESSTGLVTLACPAPAGWNIRGAGDDMHAGDRVLARGRRLTAAALGVAVAAGRAELRCARRPRVAIVATGDELRVPGASLAPGEIHNSNAVTLQALARRCGAQTSFTAGSADEQAQTAAVIGEALATADVLVVSGGVSVGPHDHVKAALASLGVQERFWRIALRPGKPTWFGVHDRRLVFGLPGNPVSAMVTFQLFVAPALALLQGMVPDSTLRRATLDTACRAPDDRDEAVRVSLTDDSNGLRASPTGPQGSHQLTSMLNADALMIVPAGHTFVAGQRVEVEAI